MTLEDQTVISLGGNEELANFFAKFGLGQDKTKRFNSKAADHYRCLLECKAENISCGHLNDALSVEYLSIGKEQISCEDVNRRKS